jgi:hypothetical protein
MDFSLIWIYLQNQEEITFDDGKKTLFAQVTKKKFY